MGHRESDQQREQIYNRAKDWAKYESLGHERVQMSILIKAGKRYERRKQTECEDEYREQKQGTTLPAHA